MKSVSFYHVPGYELILRTILSEMSEREAKDYPDALIKATTMMLCNPRLLSMFVKLIFKKTNVHDAHTVVLTCDTLAKWFDKISTFKNFPSNFDFPFFLKGIEIMIDLDHAVVTTKSLWLLYRIFHALPTDEKQKIVEMISK